MKTRVLRTRKSYSTGIVKVCSHNIEWRLNGRGLHLWDTEIEQIRNSLFDNCVRGELWSISNDGNEVWGWWSIQN
jgi:hypothetical protein